MFENESPDFTEASVLGAMLRDNETIPDVCRIVVAADFRTDAHQKVFQAIVSVWDKGRPVDLVTLADVLRERNQVEDIGGYHFLSYLWQASPTAANAVYYAKIVHEHALLRSLSRVGQEIAEAAKNHSGPAGELLQEAESKVFSLARIGVAGQAQPLCDVVNNCLDRIDKRSTRPEDWGLKTNFIDLDERTAGLQNSELVIIAARPSVGKTALAINTAWNVARSGATVLFSSLEQSASELGDRLLSIESGVNSHKLRLGTPSPEESTNIVSAAARLERYQMFIDDTPSQSMLHIASAARRLKNLRLLMVDYIQLVTSENKKAPRQEQVAEISRRLKCLARELKIPVVCLSQLNRESEHRTGLEPRLSDLRDSGAIEQDADTVILLHRPQDKPQDNTCELLELIIAKQRNGPTGRVKLVFDKRRMRFENFAETLSD